VNVKEQKPISIVLDEEKQHKQDEAQKKLK
jgi:hypothetical protein